MITSGEWLNPTRVVGLVAYGAATISCGLAWVRARSRGRNGRLAALLTVIEGMLLLDITFDWRWRLHEWVGNVARNRHAYESRHLPQLAALALLAGLLLLGLFAVLRPFHGEGSRSLAASGAMLSLIVWFTEVVSLHAVDHFLYYHLGQIMAVSLLWILASLMTSVAVLFVSQHTKNKSEVDRDEISAQR